MNTLKNSFTIVSIALSFLFISSVSTGAESTGSKIYTPVLIPGTGPDPGAWQAFEESDENKAELAADDRRMRGEQQMMRKDGYITVHPGRADFLENLVSSPDAQNPDDVIDLLAFRPAAFDLGLELLGVLPIPPSSDGLIYTVTTLLRHPLLGEIAINELSRKKPSKYDLPVRTIEYDLDINGNPGLFLVFKTAEDDRGRSLINILTEDKLIMLHAGMPLTEDDDLLAEFMNLAALLH